MRVPIVILAIIACACASVLGIRTRAGQPFPHRAHALEGVSCVRCHADVTSADDRSPVALPANGSCLDCHGQGTTSKPCPRAPDGACRSCHGSPDAEHFAVQARTHLRFAHRTHVRELDGSCVRCHEGVKRDDVRLLPTMPQCLSCHEHSDDFELRACDRCHERLENEGVRPTSHVVHGDDFTRRHGAQAAAQADLCATCHSETECAGCHGVKVPALEKRLDFAQPRMSGIHRAGFVARHALEARADPGLCATCHRSDTCQGCHHDAGVATGSSIHPPGWVGLTRNDHGPAARRDPMACAGCHGGAGEMLCVSCHASGGIGGSPHPPGWTSNKKRNERPCVLCH